MSEPREIEKIGLLLMKQYFPDLSFVLSDRPDLQDPTNNIGIEIMCLDKNEMCGFANKYINAKSDKEKLRAQDYIEKRGGRVSTNKSFISVTYPYHDPQEYTVKAYDKKLRKLQNDGFIKFKRNYLLIFFNTIYNEMIISNITKECVSKNNNYEYKYDKLMLATLNTIYDIDFIAEEINISKIIM